MSVKLWSTAINSLFWQSVTKSHSVGQYVYVWKGTDLLQFILELQTKVIITCDGYRGYELNQVPKKCNGIKAIGAGPPHPVCIEFENITIPGSICKVKGKKR